MALEETSPYRDALARLLTRDIGRTFLNEPLSRHCSWRIGGPADLLVEPETARQAALVVKCAAVEGIPLVVIGGGSNLLFSDRGVRGVVLKIAGRMSRCSVEGNRLIADAGVWVPRLARKAGQAGISGFEHAAGIPGTLGGLVLMNGGSQRESIGSNVVRVSGITRDGESFTLLGEECGFTYRHSKLQGRRLIVTEIELKGNPGDPRVIRAKMLGILRERRKKFPLKQPNCGSVFLSTPELHAAFGPPGKVIELAGLKGLTVGDAQVSQKHANFIVNLGNASSSDVLKLVELVHEKVYSHLGVNLASEALFVSEQGNIHTLAEGEER